MTAPAGWQKGSFRGVPFVTQGHETSGGRRLITHEFPQGEKPVLEDMGKRAGRFSIECFVIGEDHIASANRLTEALDKPGAGTLIHPWLGSMQVGVEQYGRRDSVSDGRITSFSIDFIESGLPALPPPAIDTAAQARSVAAAQTAAAKQQFGKSFSVAKVTAFVEQAADELVQAAAFVARVRAALAAGPLGALQIVFDALGVAGVVRDTLGLAQSIGNMVQILGTIGGGLGAMEALVDWGDDLPPVNGSTPARARQRANQAAIVQLVNSIAAAELVYQIAATTFDSYEDAIDVRDRTADRLDRLALRQADAGDDEGAMGYDALRRAMIRDVTARGGSIARLQRFVPATTESAILIAHRLYGTGALEARAEQIVARNRIIHPGFVPAARAIQVLTPGAVQEGARDG